ncbi:hypothetical protein H5410_030946 [Solanum commersonii]|uniref:Uncharacterized protein n=1 Tax=Solanum commersonii TaxID=4109 RepID=A0A9J5YIV3_SOLCO|nr:hypothetical protein H5410_030946 [Solanum commersonii]
MAKTHAVTWRRSRKNKGKASASIFIDSDSDDLFPASVTSSLGKLPADSPYYDLADATVKSKPSSSTSVSTTKLNAALDNLTEMHTKLDTMAVTVAQVPDLLTKLNAMSEQVDSLKDLILSAYF